MINRSSTNKYYFLNFIQYYTVCCIKCILLTAIFNSRILSPCTECYRIVRKPVLLHITQTVKIYISEYHFVPIIDSTLNEIGAFFSKQGSLFVVGQFCKSLVEIKLFKSPFAIYDCVTSLNQGIVGYAEWKDCTFNRGSASCF